MCKTQVWVYPYPNTIEDPPPESEMALTSVMWGEFKHGVKRRREKSARVASEKQTAPPSPFVCPPSAVRDVPQKFLLNRDCPHPCTAELPSPPAWADEEASKAAGLGGEGSLEHAGNVTAFSASASAQARSIFTRLLGSKFASSANVAAAQLSLRAFCTRPPPASSRRPPVRWWSTSGQPPTPAGRTPPRASAGTSASASAPATSGCARAAPRSGVALRSLPSPILPSKV